MADVLVAGASGFAGALAARLIDRHPSLSLGPVTSRSHRGTSLLELYPHHRVGAVLEELDLDRHGDVDAAIVAYPHGAAAPVVAGLRERGVKVVDLSADFRLRDRGTYESWYVPHGAPQLIGGAAYGLTELNREQIAGAELVANPGCFPTGALLALAPLARAGLITDVVIDAKTGVSGAGREPTDSTHFVSVAENVKAYKVGAHRHTPEIDQELAALGAPVSVTFVPHLVPVDQGELMSCYVTAAEPVDAARIAALYEEAYAAEPFVDIVDAPPGMRDVRETNRCHISAHVDAGNGRVIVFAAIDNLWKGTSSQAVQNLNLMLGLPEGEGLDA